MINNENEIIMNQQQHDDDKFLYFELNERSYYLLYFYSSTSTPVYNCILRFFFSCLLKWLTMISIYFFIFFTFLFSGQIRFPQLDITLFVNSTFVLLLTLTSCWGRIYVKVL